MEDTLAAKWKSIAEKLGIFLCWARKRQLSRCWDYYSSIALSKNNLIKGFSQQWNVLNSVLFRGACKIHFFCLLGEKQKKIREKLQQDSDQFSQPFNFVRRFGKKQLMCTILFLYWIGQKFDAVGLKFRKFQLALEQTVWLIVPMVAFD